MQFSDNDKLLLNRFLLNSRDHKLNGISKLEDMWAICDSLTKQLIDNILALNPKEYGFKGQSMPHESVPIDVVAISDHIGNESGEYGLSATVYLPSAVYKPFTEMSELFSRDYPERKLLVGSGYRSPAFQLVTLIYILVKVYDFDIAKTLKRVALPEYSQHCSVSYTALDMLNVDGEPSDKEPQKFAKSVEYAWLIKNAAQFNFYESYPADNPDGIIWEPWHWQFRT